MDRRQQKTRKAIFTAFRTLLETKKYESITVQDIIDKANIGRSTFYAHFETKDLLLNAMCEEIFHHIFGNDPCPWVGHADDIEAKLSHTLWHIQENKNDIGGILLSDSSELFMRYFKEHLHALFDQNIDESKTDVPRDFLLSHLVGSFADAIMWWFKNRTEVPPEELAHYFAVVTHLPAIYK